MTLFPAWTRVSRCGRMPCFVQALETTTIFVPQFGPIREDRMSNKSWIPALAAAVLALASFNASAQSNEGYWGGTSGTWKNGSGQCWKPSYWTPAMATAECDPDLVAKPAPAAAPRAAAPAPAPVAPAPK